MEYIEMTGKTAEEAVEKALKLLSTGINEVNVEIIDNGSKGFLGFGQKPAKVVVRMKDDPVRVAKRFIREVSTAMGLDITIEAEVRDRTLAIDLKGQNIGVLIGKHGQTMDSLQYLTNLVVNKNKENYISVLIDTENYRAKRKENLETLAKNMAKKVRQTKRPVRLEPMSPSERRVIHAALQGERQVSTFSEGVEPFRNVVISFKRDAGAGEKSGEKSGEARDSARTGGGRTRTYSKNTNKPAQNRDNYKKFININNGGEETADDGDE
ncbi:MAG: protein jag [Defluviitaleaceae bacterium]|nr:protein jag [Defluviitaleaceae bacterium]MCL2835939.1 protein jag [Defluviitaleaceae bacterium]